VLSGGESVAQLGLWGLDSCRVAIKVGIDPFTSASSNPYLSELERLPKDSHFIDSASRQIDEWIAGRTGLDSVAGVLRSMEVHPEIAYGTPDPLVDFAERFADRNMSSI